MNSEQHITSWCTISGNEAWKDGTLIFRQSGATTADFLLSLYQHHNHNYPRFHKMDGLSKLGWIAADILLSDLSSSWPYQPQETGVVLSNVNSSFDTDVRYCDTINDVPSPALFVYTLPNIVIGEICIGHNFKGENAFFISGEFNTVFIQQYVAGIVGDDLSACVCGWIELFGSSYKAVLYLVEQRTTNQSIPFTARNMEKIFRTKT